MRIGNRVLSKGMHKTSMKAPRGKVIVKFFQYRRTGTIIIPDAHQPQSVECEVISDSAEEWDGEKAIASLMDGTYFEVDGDEYCVLKRKSILMFFVEQHGKIQTVRPATRGVIIEDRGRVEKVGQMFMPENDNRFPGEGRVLAVGPGEWSFSEGDVVYFDRSKAVVIAIDGKRALFIFEPHIYAMERMAA